MTACVYCGYPTRFGRRVCKVCARFKRNDPHVQMSAPLLTRYDAELADTLEAERIRRDKW